MPQWPSHGLTDVERFWSHVEKTPTCWLWRAKTNPFGYGIFWLKKGRPAHIVVWEWAYGPIPAGHKILHHCDVPGCVRPDHLYAGTQRDNMHDMIRKGRRRLAVGEGMPTHKLTGAEVKAIRTRAETETQASLAAEYNVHQCTISRIVARRRWKHDETLTHTNGSTQCLHIQP